MKSKTVETIVTNDEHIRCRIYDGDIPPGAYWENMARLNGEQLKATKERLSNAMLQLAEAWAELERLRA